VSMHIAHVGAAVGTDRLCYVRTPLGGAGHVTLCRWRHCRFSAVASSRVLNCCQRSLVV